MKLVPDIDFTCRETAFLSDCVMRPADVRKYGQYYLLTPESFASPCDGKSKDAFLDLQPVPMWCRALADFKFRFDCFQDDREEKGVKGFLRSVDEAAQMLWVDRRVCEAAAEKPKNAKKPRPQKRRA